MHVIPIALYYLKHSDFKSRIEKSRMQYVTPVFLQSVLIYTRFWDVSYLYCTQIWKDKSSEDGVTIIILEDILSGASFLLIKKEKELDNK